MFSYSVLTYSTVMLSNGLWFNSNTTVTLWTQCPPLPVRVTHRKLSIHKKNLDFGSFQIFFISDKRFSACSTFDDTHLTWRIFSSWIGKFAWNSQQVNLAFFRNLWCLEFEEYDSKQSSAKLIFSWCISMPHLVMLANACLLIGSRLLTNYYGTKNVISQH